MRVFERPFTISEAVGNNRFGQPEGVSVLPLAVGKRVFSDFSKLSVGLRVAFREFDDKGGLCEYLGLESFVSSTWNGIPTHVFDNHNLALAYWIEAYSEGILSRKCRLVHIDMHSDLWPNAFDFDIDRADDVSYVEDFVHRKTEVGNYIEPAMRSGLIGEVIKIEGEDDLVSALSFIESEARNSSVPTILNLDLDFFAPDLDYIPFELKKRTILAFAKRASLITVATSPSFVDQYLALRRFRDIFQGN